MQRIPVAIPAAQLTTSAATYYTSPTATVSTIGNLSLTNTSANPVSVTLYNVPNAGAAGAGNAFLSGFVLSAGQTYVPPSAIGLQLAAGATLQALAGSATSITMQGGVYQTSGS